MLTRRFLFVGGRMSTSGNSLAFWRRAELAGFICAVAGMIGSGRTVWRRSLRMTGPAGGRPWGEGAGGGGCGGDAEKGWCDYGRRCGEPELTWTQRRAHINTRSACELYVTCRLESSSVGWLRCPRMILVNTRIDCHALDRTSQWQTSIT